MYAGFLPILCKQIPYAIGQFTVNELCHEAVFRSMSEEKLRATQASRSAMFGINLGSGIIAGFAAAILSQISRPTEDKLQQTVGDDDSQYQVDPRLERNAPSISAGQPERRDCV